MKKIFFSLLILFCLDGFIFSQWSQYSLPYNGLAQRMDFYDLNNGISCGNTTVSFNGKIFYTVNSGANWISSSYPPDLRAITGVRYINSSLIYAWGAQNNFSNFSSYTPFFSFKELIKNDAYIKGIFPNWEYYKGVLIKSTDAGLNWNKVGRLDSLSGYINGIHFFDANTGYAVIDTNPSCYPKFCKTTNGGLNWQKIFKLDSNFITESVNFINLNTGFFCGYLVGGPNVYASIYKTTNGGINWTQRRFGYTGSILEISFFNSTTGVAIGNPNNGSIGTKIYKTTNTGTTWDSVYYYPDYPPQFIKTINATGTAFGSGYLAYDTMTSFTKTCTFKTTDYGLSWTIKTFTTNKLITGGKLIDQNNFFMSGGDVGSSAVILKSTNGGNVFVNQIGSGIPSSFSLSQNYPNPFNPATNIRYKIPEKSFVSLKIYNILGNEVSALVNEKQAPGEYEVTFEGSSLNSGIYFCSLRTENYSDTKKMIMIK